MRDIRQDITNALLSDLDVDVLGETVVRQRHGRTKATLDTLIPESTAWASISPTSNDESRVVAIDARNVYVITARRDPVALDVLAVPHEEVGAVRCVERRDRSSRRRAWSFTLGGEPFSFETEQNDEADRVSPAEEFGRAVARAKD